MLRSGVLGLALDVDALAALAGDRGVGRAGDGGTDDRGHPEQPELRRGVTAVEEGDRGRTAGLTEVFVTGIEMRWMSVSPRPMAIGAKPTGARPSVAPRMM